MLMPPIAAVRRWFEMIFSQSTQRQQTQKWINGSERTLKAPAETGVSDKSSRSQSVILIAFARPAAIQVLKAVPGLEWNLLKCRFRDFFLDLRYNLQ